MTSPTDSGDPTVAGTLSGAIAAANAASGTEINLDTNTIALSGTLPALVGNAATIIGTTALTGTLSATGLDVSSGQLNLGTGFAASFTGSSGTNAAGPAVTLGNAATLDIAAGSQAAGGTVSASYSTGGTAVVVNAPTSAASIVNQGSIIGGAGGTSGFYATGGNGINATGNLTLSNAGTIAGGQGGGVAFSGGLGGTGIEANAGAGAISLTNLSGGVIEGGIGGVPGSGDINGTGIATSGNVSIINQSGASILGDSSGVSGVNYSGGVAIAAGAGAAITNAGTIAGSGGGVERYAISANGSTIVNQSGGLIEGGNGTESGAAGAAAITGYDLAITNAGTIQGGRAASGAGAQADAIDLTGGTNTLTLQPGSTITGNVVAAGSSNLVLGGGTAGTFDMANLGSTAQYQGFTGFDVTGTWTLSGVSSANPAVTINGGNATVTTDGALGTGSLTVTGGGMLLLDANGGGPGSTATVQSGTLEVGDASHATATLSGDATILSGGTLMGHGTIGGNVTNGGDVHPGGSIGILHIGGNYTQSSAGTLSIEITPNAAAGPGIGYDQLAVAGTASLAGTLAVLDDAGTYSVGSRYTVLTAAGGRTGSFATVTASPIFAAYITPSVTYDANNVYLTLDPTPSATGGAPLLVNGGQQVPDMLTAMTASAAAVGDAVLADVCSAAAQDHAVPGQGCEVRTLGHGNRAELWMSSIGGLGTVTGSGARASFHDSNGGVLLGGGLSHGGLTLGLGAGYVATMLNFSDGSDASQNTAIGFVYARYTTGHLHLGAMAGYGGGAVDGTRALPGTGLTASGNRAGTLAVVQTRAAYDIALGATTIEPRATLAYLHADQAGFTETGGSLLDLTYADTGTDQLQGRLTTRVSRQYRLGDWALEPWAEAGLREAFTGLARTAYVTDGGYSASVAGVSPAPLAGVVGLGVEAATTHGLDVFLHYQGQFAANLNENAFSAGIAAHF
ncbi:MAG: autotransporter domain-containing protein [Rhodospirillales bacterium]|nr:autotransporter domain-containing protein [Rhodospirillales bacterium]